MRLFQSILTLLCLQQWFCYCFCNNYAPTSKKYFKVARQGRQDAPPERPSLVLEALQQNKTLYYFGLGSNMSRKKLENRGLNGTKIDILRMEAAVVPNHRLAFNLRGFPPIEPGMGSLEPTGTNESQALLEYGPNECHGALCHLTAENYEKVMRSEGVGNPQQATPGRRRQQQQGYEEVVVDAYPYSSWYGQNARGWWRQGRPKPVQAIALRALPHVRLSVDPCPSRRYMSILREGAQELGLQEDYQDFLAQHPVQELTWWQGQESLYNLLFTFTLSQKLGWRGFSRFQSHLLYACYAPPTASLVRQWCSTLISALILLPGSLMGALLALVLCVSGQGMPPMWTRLSQMVDANTKNTTAV